MKTYLKSCLLLFFLLNACYSVAQPDLSDYYTVELIIFSNEEQKHFDEETWPLDISLTLPDTLLYPVDIAVEKIYPELPLLLQQQNMEEDEQALITELLKDIAPEDPVFTQFLPLLDDAYREHGGAATRISRSGKHRLLFHRAWVQHIGDEDSAASVVIEAGNEQQGYHELAGSIKLYKSRFLHLQTDLWRLYFDDEAQLPTYNDYDEDEQQTPEWPHIPYIVVPSIPALEDEDNEEAVSASEEQATDAYPQGITAMADKTLPFADAMRDEELTLLRELFGDELLTPAQPAIKAVGKMQRNRRMRSREIHHIDHPLFGLLIEIRPYQPLE